MKALDGFLRLSYIKTALLSETKQKTFFELALFLKHLIGLKALQKTYASRRSLPTLHSCFSYFFTLFQNYDTRDHLLLHMHWLQRLINIKIHCVFMSLQ